MEMQETKFDFSKVEEAIVNVGNYQQELEDAIDKLGTAKASAEVVWSGEAKENFSSDMKKWLQHLQEMCTVLDKYKTALSSISTKFADTERDNAQRIGDCK